MIAYHFVGATLRDGRPIPADGEWLVHEGPVVMCESGLYACKHPLDAQRYALGATLCRVDCEDVVIERDDKLVCRRRKVTKRLNARALLQQFASECALSVLHWWDAPAVVREYLTTGDASLRQGARTAAYATNAATRAAKAAAAAAYAAARAADDAAYAAESAAVDAWAARASGAAAGAADAAYRERFQQLVNQAFTEAA